MTGLNNVASAVNKANRFLDLPFALLDQQPFRFFALTYDWIFLYCNPAATAGIEHATIVNESFHEVVNVYPNLHLRAITSLLKYPLVHHKPFSIRTKSRGEVWEVEGFALQDCYCITISDVVERQSLIKELRSYLKPHQNSNGGEDLR